MSLTVLSKLDIGKFFTTDENRETILSLNSSSAVFTIST